MGSINRRIMVQVDLGKKQEPISKTMRAKRAGGTVQVVEHPPSKQEALSSNPSTTKKEKMQYIHTMEYYSSLKVKEVLSCVDEHCVQ
jgi:hypothetical protein